MCRASSKRSAAKTLSAGGSCCASRQTQTSCVRVGLPARQTLRSPAHEANLIVGDAARVVTPAVQLSVIKEDPADDRILECAVTGGSDFIVTGDKDLLWLGSYDSIKILTVADFLSTMRAQGPAR